MSRVRSKQQNMLLVAGGTICTCALLIACASRIGRSKRKPYPKGKTSSTTLQALQRAIDIELKAEEIEEHINRTQIPARAMGVKVVGLTDNSLSLVAPLAKNSNVHGTAFAGSLYSVGTLASYYLCKSWVESQVELADMELHLVAKSGKVDYRRPVKGDILATSILPDENEMEEFRTAIVTKGKGLLWIGGEIKLEDGIEKGGVVRDGEEKERKLGCCYMIEMCCYVPRRRED
ncbi:hypothetical protein TrCOL_g13347 [Triparma columacea]|uniref:Thioesterase putative domain-containing protein n=1 Tax=Triparma columacea TaxID=722753 RepID=A0A9W7GQC1_9STRA|nr:hypothetical protein TrCOL_g13347 [Triparma columacea]